MSCDGVKSPGKGPEPGETNDAASSPLSSISEPDLSSFSSPTPARPSRKTRQASPSKSGDDKQQLPERPKKKSVKRPPKKQKQKWDAERLLTDPKSPLATASLRTILSNPMAWSVLDRDERAEILSLFPDKEHILDAGTDNARPNFASLLNDDSFRHDCAAYTQNIAQGRHDPDWLASAWIAHERRKAGDFEEFLTDKLQEDWGIELPEEMKVRRRKQPEPSDAGEENATDAMDAGDEGERSASIKKLDEVKMDIDGEEDPRHHEHR